MFLHGWLHVWTVQLQLTQYGRDERQKINSAVLFQQLVFYCFWDDADTQPLCCLVGIATVTFVAAFDWVYADASCVNWGLNYWLWSWMKVSDYPESSGAAFKTRQPCDVITALVPGPRQTGRQAGRAAVSMVTVPNVEAATWSCTRQSCDLTSVFCDLVHPRLFYLLF